MVEALSREKAYRQPSPFSQVFFFFPPGGWWCNRKLDARRATKKSESVKAEDTSHPATPKAEHVPEAFGRKSHSNDLP